MSYAGEWQGERGRFAYPSRSPLRRGSGADQERLRKANGPPRLSASGCDLPGHGCAGEGRAPAGVLQHTSAETGERHYNLARTMKASRRHGGAVSDLRDRLRLER